MFVRLGLDLRLQLSWLEGLFFPAVCLSPKSASEAALIIALKPVPVQASLSRREFLFALVVLLKLGMERGCSAAGSGVS